jgi:hypothetical protein
MAGMKNPNFAVWRRRIGVACAALGLLLFVAALLPYLRYASDPGNLHVQERLQHARALNFLWSASLYGSMFPFVASLFGLGLGRWVGLAANAGAFLCALMTLGAMCGPFGCQT